MMRALAVVIVVTGTWAMNFVYRDGTHTQGYCTLRQEGTRVTGACGQEIKGGAPLAGDIANDRLTWHVEEGPSYTADVEEGGTFMKGTFTGSGEGIFTATKLKMK
jgi:hypothetical protein